MWLRLNQSRKLLLSLNVLRQLQVQPRETEKLPKNVSFVAERLILGHNASHETPNALGVEKLVIFEELAKAKATSSSIIEEHVNPHLSSILASAPACLQPSVITTRANGHSAKTLVDSGSSARYINSEFCKKFGINFDDKSSMISMASVSYAVKVHGNAKVDLQVNKETYARFNLGVVDKLCAHVILGLDFMKLHEEVHFNLHGQKNVLQVNPGKTKISDEMCLVMAADVDPP